MVQCQDSGNVSLKTTSRGLESSLGNMLQVSYLPEKFSVLAINPALPPAAGWFVSLCSLCFGLKAIFWPANITTMTVTWGGLSEGRRVLTVFLGDKWFVILQSPTVSFPHSVSLQQDLYSHCATVEEADVCVSTFVILWTYTITNKRTLASS